MVEVLHVQKVAGISGSEAHLLQLLPALKQRGFDVRFLMLHERELGAREFAHVLEAGDVPVEEIELRADADPIAFGQLLARLRRRRPAILHTHLVHADGYGLAAGALARVPIRVSTKHGFNELGAGRVLAFAERSVGSLAHCQIAISRGLARHLAEAEGFRESAFEIVHYGIAAGPEPAPYPGAPHRFLCIGRLIPIKGHVVLLRAFREVLEARPEAILELAGRGVLEPSLRELARELGIEHAVHFLGHVAPVQQAIEDASAVVVPSLGEGFGMTALEAMERARPVVASAVGGLEDLVVEGDTGLLVPPADAEALARAMLAIAEDPARAAVFGLEGRRLALESFSAELCVERTEKIYRRLLAERGR